MIDSTTISVVAASHSSVRRRDCLCAGGEQPLNGYVAIE
jgi:hypothetical protein